MPSVGSKVMGVACYITESAVEVWSLICFVRSELDYPVIRAGRECNERVGYPHDFTPYTGHNSY